MQFFGSVSRSQISITAAENKPNMIALATVSFIFMGVLNEQIIYGKMHGYLMTGRNNQNGADYDSAREGA